MEKEKRDDSRIIFAYGAETLAKIGQLKVLIIGMRGIGFEIAKNIILTGGKTVSIYDPTIARPADLGANFYIDESRCGKASRAEACIGQLKELNPYLDVNMIAGPITKEVVAQYNLVYVTELILPLAQIYQLNEFCREKTPATGFIMSLCLGLYGCCFVDFGPKHVVKDPTGENPASYVVVDISKGTPGIVNVHEDKKHSYNDGDYVKFREVEGMTELNTAPPMQIKVINRQSFSIGDTSKFGDYLRAGIVENVKMPLELVFKTLAESLDQPLKSKEDSLINATLSAFGRAEQLHIGFCALVEYYSKHNALPELNNEEHAKEVVALALSINESKKAKGVLCVEKVEEAVVRNMARFAGAEITSMTSFFGGVAAQEGYKMVGKYTPLQQWLHYDCFESIPLSETVNRKMPGNRYDDIISIYGQELFAKLQDLKLLMIGAGALGCEFVKAFALMGATTNKGLLTVTDNDHIELSNLSRQFLFRQKDIGQSKSLVAGKAAKAANPQFNVKSMKDYVAASTEHIFTDDMWEGLDMIVGAVDNIKARMYVDSKCVWHSKPYLDCGTLGPKANTQVVVPKLTQSYADTLDPQEDSFPMCTIRNFPNLIEHTIEWGRSQFEGLFSDTTKNAADYIKNPEAFIKRIREGTTITGTIDVLKNITELIKLKRKNSFDACIAFAREKFQDSFNYSIAQLLYCFPPDTKDSHGMPFWAPPKRTPKVVEYDPKDELHILFVQSMAIVLAGALKISAKSDKDYIAKVAGSIACSPFVPKKVTITVDDKNPIKEELIGNEDEELITLKKGLVELTAGLTEADFAPVDFEKDDETNFHVDYIHAAANLRARNYRIPECTKLHTRGIAGRIIPAIATATAMIVGCMCNEMLKVVQGMPKVEQYKNAFVNLALPLFVFSEPAEATKIKDKAFDPIACGPTQAVPPGHTKWDRVEVKGPLTVKELGAILEREYNVELSMVTCGQVPVYMEYVSPPERLGQTIEAILEELSKKKIEPSTKSLKVDVLGTIKDKGVTAMLPAIMCHSKHRSSMC